MRACSDRGMTALWRGLLLLVAFGLLSGCSGLRLVYSNLDRAVVWRATDYVDLNRAQRGWLRQEARVYLHWHRYEQLPEWSALLTDFEAAVDDGFDLEHAQTFEERGQALFEVMMRQALPALVDLMAGFSDQQISGLAKVLEESNAELNADYEGLPEAEQRAVWREKTRDALDRWVGRLTPEQEVMLEAASQDIEPDNQEWVAFRRLWQADLIATLDAREPKDAFEARIEELMLHRERWYPDSYREVVENRQAVYRRFAVELLSNLDDAQRRRLSNRLGSLVRDFEILAATSRSAPEPAGPAPRA